MTTGMSPLDVATQVAVPEFDGRIITVPFSFKEIDSEGLISYVADPERCARVAGLAVRHARLRAIPAAEKRVALVFSAYPTKHARIGNRRRPGHPASAVALLRTMRDAGYDIGEAAAPGDLGDHCRLRRRGRTDPLSDRTRRAGPGLAHRRGAGRQSDSGPGQGLPGLVRHPSEPSSPMPSSSTGARRRESSSSTVAAIPRARSSSRPSRPATWC